MDFTGFICFYINVLILSVSGSHFRGGTISWRYLGGNMVEFRYKLAWALGSADAASWTAIPLNGGSSVTVYSGQYVKTATNSLEKWEQGEGTFTYNFTTPGPYRVREGLELFENYTSGAWISLNYGSSGNWNLETIINLHKRSDTLTPNHSPQTTSRAIYRVQFGCPVSIKIPMIDVDGDHVRCRWATSREAASISQLLPNAHLDESKCTITFTANLANNYTNNGWFAAALTIEDFPVTTITVNRNSYTASTPLTQIPLQFLIHTETMPGSCNDKPIFVSPTPSDGTVTTVKATNSFTTEFYVHADSGVKSIDINGPLGIHKTALSLDGRGRSNVWLVIVHWTPTQTDQGTHIICASAEDNHNKLSDTRCVTVIAWDVDPCDSNPCLNHATCIRSGYTSDYTCNCAQGYSGIQCQTNIDEYASTPCQHESTCVDLINDYSCVCTDGYNGIQCQTDIDECMSNPCQHDGSCTDHVNAYSCTCLSGFTGDKCQIDINECASDPCQHGGDCSNLIDAFLCHCPLGYTGINCQIDINECISQPCQNGATCINLVNDFKCSCVNGYTGRNCETDIDDCSSNPCYNNGTCVDKIVSWSCACIPGYNGTQCQTDINECSSSPCQHNGTCINQINGYRCECENDSSGDNCQIWMNHCSSDPCLNGGACLNRYNGYRCTCPQSWYGDVCEYRQSNQTEVCSDLDYTECSCHVSKFKFIQRKSHRIQFGFVGFLSGLLGTIFLYIIWNFCRRVPDKNNKVNTRIQPRKNNIITLSDLEAEESGDTSNNILNSQSENDYIGGCECFIDHTGYDHFQRFDKRLKYKYRFHNCRNKKGFKKENPAITKTRTH